MRQALCVLVALLSLSAAPLPQAECEAVHSDRCLVRRRHGAGADAGARARARARGVEARLGDHQGARVQQRQDLGGLGERGTSARTYRFDALEQLLTLADEQGLRVIVQSCTDAAHQSLGARYPDSTASATRGGDRVAASPSYCLDHPSVRADVTAFIGACERARRRASLVHGIDVWSRTAHRQLGLVQHAGRDLLLPAPAGPVPHRSRRRPHPRRAEYGVHLARSRRRITVGPRYGRSCPTRVHR